MISQDLISEVSSFLTQSNDQENQRVTGVPNLIAVGTTCPHTVESTIYEPVMCLVLQGEKEAHLGDRVIRYGAGQSLIVSHAVPVRSGIIHASSRSPYLALILRLDLDILRSLIHEIGIVEAPKPSMHAMNVANADADLNDAITRLFRLSHTPLEVQALGPLVLREIHFRLLRAQHGGMLRQLLVQDSPANRISRAIAQIRSNYRATIPVADLAASAGMSQSAFHEHFKSLTSTTPLQFQKDLRLLEARRLLLSGSKSVAAAAFDVGYESPTQFSREYARKFGVPPRQDKAQQRRHA
jgi:AraC-like DNA-binding protein